MLESFINVFPDYFFAGASFGDVETEIHKNGMKVVRKMA